MTDATCVRDSLKDEDGKATEAVLTDLRLEVALNTEPGKLIPLRRTARDTIFEVVRCRCRAHDGS